jgi:hypothetical protein
MDAKTKVTLLAAATMFAASTMFASASEPEITSIRYIKTDTVACDSVENYVSLVRMSVAYRENPSKAAFDSHTKFTNEHCEHVPAGSGSGFFAPKGGYDGPQPEIETRAIDQDYSVTLVCWHQSFFLMRGEVPVPCRWIDRSALILDRQWDGVKGQWDGVEDTCKAALEEAAYYNLRWTKQGISAFNTLPRVVDGHVFIGGDRAESQLQNGMWIQVMYRCEYDPVAKTVKAQLKHRMP